MEYYVVLVGNVHHWLEGTMIASGIAVAFLGMFSLMAMGDSEFPAFKKALFIALAIFSVSSFTKVFVPTRHQMKEIVGGKS